MQIEPAGRDMSLHSTGVLVLSGLGQEPREPCAEVCCALDAGHVDADTREWTDGVLTAAARAVAKEPLEQRSWIVCDGDVDPEWIESLNSVLDDNRQAISWNTSHPAFKRVCLTASLLQVSLSILENDDWCISLSQQMTTRQDHVIRGK